LVQGEDTLAGWRWWGVNILEDARHCSVLYIRKYFYVGAPLVFDTKEDATEVTFTSTVYLVIFIMKLFKGNIC
jgi:hypothetical protein